MAAERGNDAVAGIADPFDPGLLALIDAVCRGADGSRATIAGPASARCAAPLDISAGTPRVIGAPVKGDHWVALNGCCQPGFPHRSSLATFNGMLVNGQRFAIDWKQLDDSGRFYEGDKTKNDSYVDYGSAIYAVADGTITSTLDKLDPGTPGVLPATDPVLGPQITARACRLSPKAEELDGSELAGLRESGYAEDMTEPRPHAANPTRPVAIVTGASRGLGFLPACELADRGHDLVVNARSADALAASRDGLRTRSRAPRTPRPGHAVSGGGSLLGALTTLTRRAALRTRQHNDPTPDPGHRT